jgi:CRP/FNR family cyclic AMP-dependent transcriptional regulator
MALHQPKPAAPAAPPKPGAPAGSAPPIPGPSVLKLKKGQLLFSEGENSRAMYLLKSGMIRIFKKKGESSIEIDTIHSGQVLGELAFLDGNPRSASGEALTDCELAEISGPTFQAVISKMPDWLKILLKTIVGRLRTASTRIRQLETASSAMDYNDKDGKKTYVYLSNVDVLKLGTTVLLVASRNGARKPEGIELKQHLLTRYGNQIIGVPSAKMTTFLDVLAQVGVVKLTDTGEAYLCDIDFLEQLVTYLNEEYLLEPAKRHDISLRGFFIMSLIVKNIARFPADPKTGLSKVNVAEILKLETPAGGKEPFRMDEFPELVKLGYCTNVGIKSSTEAFTELKPENFVHNYRMQRVAMAINAVNEQKRKGGSTSNK